MNNTSSRHIIHNRIYYYGCIAFVFFLPVYGKIIPPIIGIMVLNWLIDGRFIKTIPLIFRQQKRFLVFSFSLIYVLYMIGMVYSHNFQYGWFDLEVKFSLLVFPLLFSTLDEAALNRAKINSIFKLFVLGCFAGSVVLLSHALFNKLNFNTGDAFV